MLRPSPFLRALWGLARPYWFSEKRWRARALLSAVVILQLALVGLSVLINRWQAAFFNALDVRDWDAFLLQLGYFAAIAAGWAVATVYALYFNQMLQIEWRQWQTDRLLQDWTGRRIYYRMHLLDRGTDNPDQRLSEDLRLFVNETLALGLGLLSAIVSLVSFIGILWALSNAIVIPWFGSRIRVPGYLVWIALVYSVIGTAIAHRVGKPLVALNFMQQRAEADFRFALVRLRENTEGVALSGGEAGERSDLRGRFSWLAGNWRAIMEQQKRLTWFTTGFAQAAYVFPFLVASPAYFAGLVSLGSLVQASGAFTHVQGALSWFVDSYARLADWKATVDRLTGFRQAILSAQAANGGIEWDEGAPEQIRLSVVTLKRPDGARVLGPVDIVLRQHESVLITGPSGSGKSMLFRAIAGVWPFGTGRIFLPANAHVMFLPQQPYMPMGSLKAILTYPEPPERFADRDVVAVLHAVGLGSLAERISEGTNWAQTLSPGEQQRIAVGRAILQHPEWLFIDDALAQMEEEVEVRLYRLMRARLPQTTFVSVSHREAIRPFHARHLAITVTGDGIGRLVEREI
ncbi:MAG: ABC transporter ATP-binding protein/permease [Alphaproteobacteria bacterium]|nr:ABC transporter ATP-binding protein/permease [Alphaproteobacteria bacterium]